MRYARPLWVIAFLLLWAWYPRAEAAETTLQEGTVLPEILLPGISHPADRAYLEISAAGPFRLRDIQADAVVIQIFHSG